MYPTCNLWFSFGGLPSVCPKEDEARMIKTEFKTDVTVEAHVFDRFLSCPILFPEFRAFCRDLELKCLTGDNSMVLNSQPKGLFFEPLEGGGQSKKFALSLVTWVTTVN